MQIYAQILVILGLHSPCTTSSTVSRVRHHRHAPLSLRGKEEREGFFFADISTPSTRERRAKGCKAGLAGGFEGSVFLRPRLCRGEKRLRRSLSPLRSRVEFVVFFFSFFSFRRREGLLIFVEDAFSFEKRFHTVWNFF